MATRVDRWRVTVPVVCARGAVPSFSRAPPLGGLGIVPQAAEMITMLTGDTRRRAIVEWFECGIRMERSGGSVSFPAMGC